MASPRKILVTGANQGIGLALVKRLVTEKGCFVYLGARDAAKGEAAKASLGPAAADAVQVVPIDVTKNDTIQALKQQFQADGVKLYALVNNAGVGFASPGDTIDINYHGLKRVTDALVDFVEARIVNVSSGAASMWLRNQDAATQALFSDPDSIQALDAAVAKFAPTTDFLYGLSKAANTAVTVAYAKQYPHLQVVSLSPGYVETRMTADFGDNKITPEQGTTSLMKCLFEDVTSGWYYGSDGLRSPLTGTRDPGTPEYQGEANPDPAKYNK